MEFRSMNDRPAPAHQSGPEAPAHHTPKNRRTNLKMPGGKMLMWAIALIILAGAVGTAAYYINRYHDSQQQVKKLSNPTAVAQLEQQQLISKIGSLTVLPKDETPTIATVTDITKLKDQPFFAAAQNGDKVLIYTKAKQAFLYRPSTNKIINIAPVNLGSGQTSTTPTNQTPTSTKR